MADAVVVQIAKQVVTTLSAASLSQSLTVSRAYRPVRNLEDMPEGTWYATVMAPRVDVASATRGRDQHDYTTEIAVQTKLGSEAASDLDPAMLLMEEVVDLFRGTTCGTTGAKCLSGGADSGADVIALYLPEHVQQKRAFTGVVRLQWRLWRAQSA